jgi:hypothetical protein
VIFIIDLFLDFMFKFSFSIISLLFILFQKIFFKTEKTFICKDYTIQLSEELYLERFFCIYKKYINHNH